MSNARINTVVVSLYYGNDHVLLKVSIKKVGLPSSNSLITRMPHHDKIYISNLLLLIANNCAFAYFESRIRPSLLPNHNALSTLAAYTAPIIVK